MKRSERDAWVAALRDKSIGRELTCTSIQVLRDEFDWILPVREPWARRLVDECLAHGMPLDKQADWIEANVPVEED